jgi:exodeoxyribonuclease VII small subunit
MSKKSRPADSLDFEKSLAELEKIVERLELGELSLDESLKQFERGIALTRSCQGSLQQAEQKVEILLRSHRLADQVEVAPFAPEEDEA